MNARPLLLATVAALALTSTQARAQVIVNDPLHTMRTVLGYAQQARHALEQMQQLQRQYMLLTSTYNAVAGARDVGGIARALGGVTRTYVPEASGALSTIQQGSALVGSLTNNRRSNSVLHQLPASIRGMRTAERWLMDMERREVATAQAQAAAQAGVAEMAQRIAALQAAQLAVSTAPTLQSLTAANGLIAVSGQNIAMHQASIASLQLALASEDRVERQRDEQRQVQGAAEWAEQTQWAVEALGR